MAGRRPRSGRAGGEEPTGPPAELAPGALGGCRWALINTGIFSFWTNLLMLTGPLFMLQVYDRVLTSGSIPTLVMLMVLVAGLYGFMAVLELVRSRVLVRIGQRLDENLKDRVFAAIMAIGSRSGQSVGTLPLRDLDTVRHFLTGPGPFAFFDTPWVPVYLAVIFLMSPLMGWFAVAAGLLLFVLALVNELLTKRPLGEAARTAEEAQRLADEVHRQSDVVIGLGMSAALGRRWAERKDSALERQARASDRAGSVTALSKSFRMLAQSGMLGLGAWLAVRQEITPGTMIAASIIMSRALAPLDQLIASWRGFISARAGWARLRLVLTAPAAPPVSLHLSAPQGRIEVSQLSALAPSAGRAIVSGVTFRLEAGAGLGIIGPSGAGKSTLAKAIMGIWPMTQGEVRLDGATYDQWDRERLGPHLGYLPQEVDLLEGTIAENIARFQSQVDAESVIEAARLARVHELILSFDNGYDTPVGIGGVQLSAGQRQRIALARAVFGHPALVVLDEPNAHLDAEGEAALVEAVRALRARGSTVVVVAHRPSAIGAVDLLLHLQNGKQVAFGDKEQVLKQVTRPVPKPAVGHLAMVPAE